MAKPDDKFFFFYKTTKVGVTQASMTGAEIKAAIKLMVPDFNTGNELVLEGQGAQPDKLINDTDPVSLVIGHGEGPKRFFDRPPTNFG